MDSDEGCVDDSEIQDGSCGGGQPTFCDLESPMFRRFEVEEEVLSDRGANEGNFVDSLPFMV